MYMIYLGKCNEELYYRLSENIYSKNTVRTPDGQWLYACSHDGTVACLKLDDGLMRPAPDEEIVS